MASGKVLEGVFAINKPIGMSSAQVIRDCQDCFNPSALFKPLIEQEKAMRLKESSFQRKRRSKVKQEIRVKMGHGGTLDPLATGVLILGAGKGTKALQGFLDCTKTYEAVVLFGASTDTYDRVGRIIKRGRYDEVTRPAVEQALEAFRGRYKQMPPLYSALKMDGKPLYEYAREGRAIPREIATRDVDVTELELAEWYEPGTHRHWWPTEEAPQTEKNLVDSVWQVAKQQARGEEPPPKLTAEQAEQETKALEEWKTAKRAVEERVDTLVSEDRSPKRRKVAQQGRGHGPEAMMSGALGKLPPAAGGKGSNLVPPPPTPDTPPPWEGKGPPAAKLRMTVTSGFYVRSLCHDLGEKLQCGAMMAELCRSRQGEFVVGSDNCLEYSDLAEGEDVWGPKVARMLSMWMDKADPSRSIPDRDGAAAAPAETSHVHDAAEDKPTAETSKRDTTPLASSPAPNNAEKTPEAEPAGDTTREPDTHEVLPTPSGEKEEAKAHPVEEIEPQPGTRSKEALADSA